ncbi:MAG: DUF4097 family beta strand repeat-containing protein [Saprospiraceae bacterium]
MKKTILFSNLFCLLFLGFNNLLQAQSRQFDQSFSGADKIEMDIPIGLVEIKPSPSAEILVKGYFDDDKIEGKAWKDGSTLKIVEKTRRKNQDSAESRWELLVPEGMDIQANFGTGNVALTSFTGQLKGNAGTSGLKMKDCKGAIKWNTGTGACLIQDCKGELNLNTGTGDIHLENVSGEFSANSGTGNLTAENCQGKINLNSGTGDVKAGGLTLTDASNFNAGTGNVQVALGSPASADLSVNSGTGKAILKFNGHAFAGSLVMSCQKDDGTILAPYDFDEEWTERQGKKNQVIYKRKQFGEAGNEVRVGTGSGKAIVSE